ncbi:hypothetical protein UlMin_026351 [Ulmus minor]
MAIMDRTSFKSSLLSKRRFSLRFSITVPFVIISMFSLPLFNASQTISKEENNIVYFSSTSCTTPKRAFREMLQFAFSCTRPRCGLLLLPSAQEPLPQEFAIVQGPLKQNRESPPAKGCSEGNHNFLLFGLFCDLFVKDRFFGFSYLLTILKMVKFFLTSPGNGEILIDNKQHYKFLGKNIDVISLIKLDVLEGKVFRHEDWWDKKPLWNRDTIELPLVGRMIEISRRGSMLATHAMMRFGKDPTV